MKLNTKLIFLLILPLVALKCNDNNEAPKTSTSKSKGELRIMLDHKVSGQILQLNSAKYLNANNDTFNITKFKYLVSNIRLYKNGELLFSEPESYHLVDIAGNDSIVINVENVNANNYDKIEFSIGVDSTRNHSGDQTGALSPDNDMYWTWNTGYIFLKFEGNYFNTTSSPLSFHVGTDDLYKTIQFDNSINIESGKTTMAHFMVNINELFANPNSIDFAVTQTDNTTNIAENYSNMFMLHHVEVL